MMFDLLVALCLYNEIVCRQQKIINYAYRTAEFHKIDPNNFLVLLSCESKMREDAVGDFRSETGEFMAQGIAQWWLGSFNTYSKKFNLKLDYWNTYHQIDLAVLTIAYDKKGWRNWYNCGLQAGYGDRSPPLVF